MNIRILSDKSEIDSIDFTPICSYHWEGEAPYRPKTLFKIALVKNQGLYCVMKCYEASPKTVYTHRDEPIYKDSCLEFFVAPLAHRSEYINVEFNSVGAFLSEFGATRDGRRFVKDFCTLSPIVTPFSSKDSEGDFWGGKLFLSYEFLSALYSENVCEGSIGSIKANLYKCGDDTETPHYLAFAPVNSMPPGFHNPDCFYTFGVTAD